MRRTDDVYLLLAWFVADSEWQTGETRVDGTKSDGPSMIAQETTQFANPLAHGLTGQWLTAENNCPPIHALQP